MLRYGLDIVDDDGSLDTNLQIKIVTSNIEYYALHMVFFVAAAEEERCRCSFDFHMSSARKLALNKTTSTTRTAAAILLLHLVYKH